MDCHQHLLIDAVIKSPINDEKEAKRWMKRLVKAVDMEIFGGPWAKYCYDKGNEGLSALIWLKTSHASIHQWPETNTIKMDLYSCKKFTIDPVLELFQVFNPISLNYTMIDRTSGNHIITDQGSLNFD